MHQPDRPPTSQARRHQDRLQAALPRLPAYEQLRASDRVPPEHAEQLLDAWLGWARRRRLPSFVKLAKMISAHRDGILAAITHGFSNARVEAVDTQIRILTRRAIGFQTPATLIALAMHSLNGLCPLLPGEINVHQHTEPHETLS